MARFIKPKNLRKLFPYPTKDAGHFFPGHMGKGMNDLQRKLKIVDCILEVHDARIPFTGRNDNFKSSLLMRPHVLLLNKTDLADVHYKPSMYDMFKEQGISKVMNISCLEQSPDKITKTLLPVIIDIIKSSPRYHRQFEDEFNLLVIGVPNVGKSTLINFLRRLNMGKGGKATAVGAVAGMTKSVLERIKISINPLVYIYDSPGIMHPNLTHMETVMKLALCGTIKDHFLSEETIVDFMLFWFNHNNNFNYVTYYNLPAPTDNVMEFLAYIAKANQYVIKKKSVSGGAVLLPDFTKVAKLVLRDFRKGHLGKVNLDSNVVNPYLVDNTEVT